MRIIDETDENEEEVIKRVENFQEAGNNPSDNLDMDFGGTGNTGTSDPVSLNDISLISTFCSIEEISALH